MNNYLYFTKSLVISLTILGILGSFGGEVIYHNLTSTKYSLSPGVSSTLSFAENGSSTSINFAFLYHF